MPNILNLELRLNKSDMREGLSGLSLTALSHPELVALTSEPRTTSRAKGHFAPSSLLWSVYSLLMAGPSAEEKVLDQRHDQKVKISVK